MSIQKKFILPPFQHLSKGYANNYSYTENDHIFKIKVLSASISDKQNSCPKTNQSNIFDEYYSKLSAYINANPNSLFITNKKFIDMRILNCLNYQISLPFEAPLFKNSNNDMVEIMPKLVTITAEKMLGFTIVCIVIDFSDILAFLDNNC